MEKLLKLIRELTWYNKVEKSKEIFRLLTSTFLQDAPQDGNTYGRKDGEWEQLENLNTLNLEQVTTQGNTTTKEIFSDLGFFITKNEEQGVFLGINIDGYLMGSLFRIIPDFGDLAKSGIIYGNNLTGLREYELPNKNGTIALQEDLTNGYTISDTTTLNVSPTQENSYYTFTGTTATWTLGSLPSTANKFIALINMGSGNITLNTNTGNNDLWDSGVEESSKVLMPGMTMRLFNNSLKYIINP